jgi:maleate isomerase
MSPEDREGVRIGVLVPFTNTNLEPDMMMMRPRGATLHFHRLGNYDADKIPGAAQMAGLGASDISQDLRLICGVRPNVVLYGCTSATLTHGSNFDKDLADRIKADSNALSLTAAGCLIEALNALDITRVGFASPYVGEINRLATRFLKSRQITTVECADIGRELGNYGQGALSPDEVTELACRADHPDAEALVLSCTDMRSVEVIERIESLTGKPVITSNQAMMFCLTRALALPWHNNTPGQLFDSLKAS